MECNIQHSRHSLRLKNFDYSQAGMYFITIFSQGKLCLFGQVINNKMELNEAGEMLVEEWSLLSERFTGVVLHDFVVMPNHFHAILEFIEVHHSLGEIVGAFKSLSSNKYIFGVKVKGWPQFNSKLWQRNYYEHVIRNEKTYIDISEYIISNPIKWGDDKYYIL